MSAVYVMLSSWFELSVPFLEKHHSIRHAISFVIHALIWSLFIIVTVVYSEVILNQDTQTIDCPGRIEAPPSSLDSDTRTLSIIYQSIIIVCIFLLALVFVLTARKIFVIIARLRKTAGADSKSNIGNRIFSVAFVVISGFLLRCILFIIILAADFESTIYMFITLLITEVSVIFLVTIQFGLFREALLAITTSFTSSSTSSSSMMR